LTWLSQRRPGQGRRSLFLAQHQLLGFLRVKPTGFLGPSRPGSYRLGRPGPSGRADRDLFGWADRDRSCRADRDPFGWTDRDRSRRADREPFGW